MVFAIEVLSRGRGVPAEARELLRQAQLLIDRDRENGVAVRSETTRLGLEGETRLCVGYEDRESAEETLRQIERMAEGVDLVNLAVGSCWTDSNTPEPGNPGKEN